MGTIDRGTMADDQAAAEMKKKRTFRKYTYRGVDLDQLLDMNNEQLMELFPCRIRRKFSRGLEETDGAHQEAQEEEEGGAAKREAGRRQDAPPGHDHRSRDDWLRRRGLQRKDL